MWNPSQETDVDVMTNERSTGVSRHGMELAPRPAVPDGLLPRPTARATRTPRLAVGHWIVIAALALIAVVLVGMWMSTLNSERAWRQKARAAEADVAQLERTNRTLERELDRVRSDLSASEADVVRLTERVDELANEKANAEDQRNLAVNERNLMLDLAAAATTAADDMNLCNTASNDLAVALFEELPYAASYGVNWARLQRLAATTDGACATAQASYASFVNLASSL
jgi:outer membrane murein-binding lipoprotein Lpp